MSIISSSIALFVFLISINITSNFSIQQAMPFLIQYLLKEYIHADSCNTSRSKLDDSPNFLIIVADDLGWSDVSPFAYSPTRSMLMSGTDNHIAGFGQMRETIRLNPDIWLGKSGYEGYFTTMSGKWYIGSTLERLPSSRGFDESFVLLDDAANQCFSKSTNSVLTSTYVHNFKLVNDTLLEDFYSSDYFVTQLINALKVNKEKDKKPFFAYLPFTAPHWPLQAPPDLIAKYKGMYEDGPAVLRKKRLALQRQLGLLLADAITSPVYANIQEWQKLAPSERAFSEIMLKGFLFYCVLK
ncbi:hypothetical protein I4U23_005213 [Adineta vaga]|nr:hypothetical protein I4U23_005213 [Adineta vaga]